MMTGAPVVAPGLAHAVSHGPFYRSDELVAGVHHAEGGTYAGFRAAHAVGRIYAGTFTATPVAKTLSRAAHFEGAAVPVTARLSGASGDPSRSPRTSWRWRRSSTCRTAPSRT
jgi:hypothetical protein